MKRNHTNLCILWITSVLAVSSHAWQRRDSLHDSLPDTSTDFQKDIRLEEEELSLNIETGSDTIIPESYYYPRRVQHASDFVLQLTDDPDLADDNNDSRTLRKLFIDRTQECLDANGDPKKLLHVLAPKIPAIKHSPDVALRILTARSDSDSGLAASLVGILGHVCERYDKVTTDHKEASSSSMHIIKDRRFEQLIECILCGVDVTKRRKENMLQRLDHDANPDNIEVLLDEENAQLDEGLTVRDACRAAWGMALLGVHRLDGVGGEDVPSIFVALSLRIRELLLARLQLLRQSDLYDTTPDSSAESTSVYDILETAARDLAQDAASAMWTFACVRACTCLRFAPLFEVCCSILCQDPVELRRRAQEAETTVDTMSVGTNDAVDRLARSELTVNEELDYKKQNEENEDVFHEKNTLVDRLSPTEVNDVMWALALHGSKDYDAAREEVALTTTGAALREIAFDRLVVWLRRESESVRLRNEEGQAFERPDESVTVEVVDASELLRSEVECMSQENQGVGSTVTTHTPSNSFVREDEMDYERLATADTVEAARSIKASRGRSLGALTVMQVFAPHDLCSLAWAVTELDDSLRFVIVSLVASILSNLSDTARRRIEGGDLSNLAWAIAKTISLRSAEGSDSMFQVTDWIVAQSVSLQSVLSESPDDLSESMMKRFHPPELSRLIWSVASVMSLSSSETRPSRTHAALLAHAALLVASSNFQVFGTEDLARIVWGFLDLCDLDIALSDPRTAEALGKAFAAIETSLSSWENGKVSLKYEEYDGGAAKESIRFASFFGKTRIHIPFLDQKLDESNEEDYLVPSLSLTRQSNLPLLKDLPLDPSTLCKMSCSFAKLNRRHSGIAGGSALIRTGLRLLASKNGKLLRECPIRDLVRLCGALAEGDLLIGRERISLFVRRVVHLLNEHPDGRAMEDITPWENAKLLWSLGRLGVKFQPDTTTDKATAHRRLQLVNDITLVPEKQWSELSDETLVKLVRGLVLLDLPLWRKLYTVHVLKYLETRIPKITSGSLLCALTDVLATLKDELVEAASGHVAESTKVDKANATQSEEDLLLTVSPVTSDNNVVGNAQIEPQFPDLLVECGRVFRALASRSIDVAHSLTTAQLRELLFAYSMSHVLADDLVDEIERVVQERRTALLGWSSIDTGLEEWIYEGAVQAADAKRRLHGDAGSPISALRKGIKALFTSSDETDPQPMETEGNSPSDLELIDNALQSTVNLAEYVSALSTNCRLSLDRTCKEMIEGTMFELGRCNELIDHYRRIDFVSGQRKTRLDQELRRNMAKHVLSRMLP